ncbi:hypothetical protein, partial [uncultured Microbacterium sp.]|uniref:hypothetical protein n=1 Tax=uncultured Microbacterium sp. TaxID=191216 RepID=UPI0028D75505
MSTAGRCRGAGLSCTAERGRGGRRCGGERGVLDPGNVGAGFGAHLAVLCTPSRGMFAGPGARRVLRV